jgi:hypothetical protein
MGFKKIKEYLSNSVRNSFFSTSSIEKYASPGVNTQRLYTSRFFESIRGLKTFSAIFFYEYGEVRLFLSGAIDVE